MNFNLQQPGYMGVFPSPMQQMTKLQHPQHPMQMQFAQQQQAMPFLQPHGVQNLHQFGAQTSHRHKPRYETEDGLLLSDEEEDDRLSDEDEDEEDEEDDEEWDEEEEMQRRARASRPGSSAGFQWPWKQIPAAAGYGNRGRSNSMSRHNGRNHPMEHKRASSQPPEGGLGLHGVPQQFIHHHQVKKQQQSHQQNMNVTPFHHPMQLVQTPMAFSPQMLQFPTTPGMGAIPLQNGHPVQHPHQPQVVPKKKKHVEMKHKQAQYVPNPQWAAFAAQQPVINPFTIDPRALTNVSLHPILASDCCRHFMRFDVVRGPAMMTGPGSVTQYDSQMATLPPLTHMNIHTGVHPAPFQIVNPAGITVKDVLSFLSSVLRQKFPNSAWKKMQEQERSMIGNWFYFNRSLGALPPVEKGLLYVDMLMAKTLFAGVEAIPPKQGVTPATFVFRWASP